MTPDAETRIRQALNFLNVRCNGCKDCDNDCEWGIAKRILEGVPAFFCGLCCEIVESINSEGNCSECEKMLLEGGE